MKAVILFFLLCIVSINAQNANFTYSGLGEGQAEIVGTFNAPVSSDGYFTVNVVSDYSADVCFQEGTNAVLGIGLSGCNPEGFIQGPASDSSASGSSSDDAEYEGSTGARRKLLRRYFFATQSVSTNTNLWLRSTTYTISVTWANQPESGNSTNPTQVGNVFINVTWTVCPANNNGIGPNCTLQPNILGTGTNASITGNITPTTGFLASYEVTSGQLLTSLTFTLTLPNANASFFATSGTGSLNIYARRDAAPYVDSNQYDANATTFTNSTILLTINSPEQGIWYILVVGNATQAFTLAATPSACQAGTFPTSFDTASNMSCAAAINIIPSNSANNDLANVTTQFPANGTTFTYTSSNYTYFTWTTANLLIGVVNVDHSDDDTPGLYASTTGVPSPFGAEYVAADATSTVNFLNVGSSNGQTSDYVISVSSSTVDFEIWAGEGCANACSGQGTCPSDSGANGWCTCNAHYKDFECGTKTLKTIYIVLIAIGGAIVLTIAIGVPVGCYIKNRKRARYERV